MPLYSNEIQRVNRYITADDLEIHLHTDDPGDSGTDNRIGTIEATLASGNWSSDPDDPTIEVYGASVAFSVLDANNDHTVAWYSLWRGGTRVGKEELDSSVDVSGGSTFTLNADTITLTGSSPAAESEGG